MLKARIKIRGWYKIEYVHTKNIQMNILNYFEYFEMQLKFNNAPNNILRLIHNVLNSLNSNQFQPYKTF